MGALDLPLAMLRYGWPRRYGAGANRQPTTCRYCAKSSGLYWIGDGNDRWRLYEAGRPHVCAAYKNKDSQP